MYTVKGYGIYIYLDRVVEGGNSQGTGSRSLQGSSASRVLFAKFTLLSCFETKTIKNNTNKTTLDMQCRLFERLHVKIGCLTSFCYDLRCSSISS